MKQLLLLFTLCLSMTAAGNGQGLVNAKAPDFTLHDQFDRSFTLSHREGHVVVIIAADQDGRKQNQGWIRAIKSRYKAGVDLVGIADTRKAPFFLKGKIKKDFQKDADAILLDWDGIVFTRYLLSRGMTNIVLIDRRGRISHLSRGAADQEKLEGLFTEIDRSLASWMKGSI